MALLSSLALAGCGGTDWDDGWQAADGESIDEAIVSTGTGCPNGEVVLLHLGWPLGRPELRGSARQYIRDPSGTIVTGGEPFDPTANLPSSARFSGPDAATSNCGLRRTLTSSFTGCSTITPSGGPEWWSHSAAVKPASVASLASRSRLGERMTDSVEIGATFLNPVPSR